MTPAESRGTLFAVMPGAQRQFDVVLQAEEQGGFSVFVPALPGCASQGETREEALLMVKKSIEGYLESLEAHGDAVPVPATSARER